MRTLTTTPTQEIIEVIEEELSSFELINAEIARLQETLTESETFLMSIDDFYLMAVRNLGMEEE